MLAVLLNIIVLVIIGALSYIFLRAYRRRPEQSMTPLEVFQTLTHDTTALSVSRALTAPEYGDVGTFTGYDWPMSKKSGLQVDNPSSMSLLRLGKYIPPIEEGRPSVVGLT
jgi:hypothetical protein